MSVRSKMASFGVPNRAELEPSAIGDPIGEHVEKYRWENCGLPVGPAVSPHQSTGQGLEQGLGNALGNGTRALAAL
jgi:hypothetical protein